MWQIKYLNASDDYKVQCDEKINGYGWSPMSYLLYFSAEILRYTQFNVVGPSKRVLVVAVHVGSWYNLARYFWNWNWLFISIVTFNLIKSTTDSTCWPIVTVKKWCRMTLSKTVTNCLSYLGPYFFKQYRRVCFI